LTEHKSSRSEFSPQAEASIHLERAAYHLHEAGRIHNPNLPAYDDPLKSAGRVDARYRITGAHRRGIDSCRQIAVLRGAIALAVADGEPWPACDRTVNPSMPEAQRLSLCASKRQRYLHLSAALLADVFGYYETGLDTEDQRQAAIERQRIQREQDRDSVAAWRNRMPSTVTQLRKDDEK